MTFIRNCECQRCDLSNYFAGLLEGYGERGSTFMDVDAFTFLEPGQSNARLMMLPHTHRLQAITHNGFRTQFLVQEFKHERERLDRAVLWALGDLGARPNFTVWLVVKRDDGTIGFGVLTPAWVGPLEVITEADYQQRFSAWFRQACTYAAIRSRKSDRAFGLR